MGTIKEWIVGAVLALLASALLVSMGYLAGRASMLREYGELAGQVRQQREQADAKLAELTAQRDMKQAAPNKAAADQERKDNDAQAEIARLAGELRDRPVRVRIVPAAGGAVVVAPQVTQPAPPKLVQETPPRPTGYYRKKILDALTTP